MDLVNGALRAPGPASRLPKHGPAALVVGGGGVLGSAVLEHLLGGGRFVHVRVLVSQAFHGAVRGLEPVLAPDPDWSDMALPPTPLATLAVVVFDRERHANGRDEPFVRAAPEVLPMLARWLLRQGIRHLIVVMPHSPASLPQALKLGLANLDEQAVTSLGFEHVVFVRSAQALGATGGAADTPWPQRVANAMLRQLHLMTPASHQPVRVQHVARFVAELAWQLPASSHGSRVAPPELLWHVAQADDAAPLVQAWLEGRALPDITARRMRL